MNKLILVFLLINMPVLAEESYRYPVDLSEEERENMMQSSDKYDQCLKKESDDLIDKYEDFRQVADVAMENCSGTLTEIDKDLARMNLDPDFRRFFIRKTSQKSTKNLLPQLMMMKAR